MKFRIIEANVVNGTRQYFQSQMYKEVKKTWFRKEHTIFDVIGKQWYNTFEEAKDAIEQYKTAIANPLTDVYKTHYID